MVYKNIKIKAISPIIASILLVVIAVILVSVILSFGQNFATKGLDQTKDVKDLSKSDAEHFIYPKTFSDGVIQFSYSPPNNFGDINVTKYKILYDNNETTEIELDTPHTLKAGTNILPLDDFSDQNITTKKFTLILETDDNQYVTLKNITNPYPYVEPEPEPCSLIPENGEIYYLEHLDYIDTNTTTLAGTYTLQRDLNFLDDDSYCQPATYKSTWTDDNGWDPLGADITPFTGSFDGNNHKISNLYINRPTTDNVGFFGASSTYSDPITINFGLEDINIIGQNNVGGLIGFCETPPPVFDSYTTGVVSGNNNVGGLIGDCAYGTVSIYDDVVRCYSKTTVSGNSNVGGLIGYSRLNIYNSYATGNISGNTNVGGLVGLIYEKYIFNSYSTGIVSGSSGLSGLANDYEYSSATSSYWDMNTSGRSTSVLGTGKTTSQMKQQATFTDWDFDTVWNISGATYPYLRDNTEHLIPSITTPISDGVTFTDNVNNFIGTAINPQGSYTCSWNSSRDGNLGTGCSITKEPYSLSLGMHIITLSITDETQTKSTTIILNVSEIF